MILTKYPSIQVDGFGFMPGDYRQIVRRYTMTNKNNATVRLISLGAAVQSLTVPNRNDDLADVVLGFDSVSEYLENRYIGRIINRASNPFAKGTTCCEQPSIGDIDIVNWDSYVSKDNRVIMTQLSVINEEDRPDTIGYLMTQVSYVWSDDNQLRIEIRATSTRNAIVDISSYCLFNLAGHGMGPKELKRHVVTVNADKRMVFNVTREEPTGEIKADPNGLNSPTRLSSNELYRVLGGGYNHHFCITNPSTKWMYRFHARMLHPPSGRSLDVYSNQPTLQLYTGNNLPDVDRASSENSKKEIFGKDGASYVRHGCFALVPQGYPRVPEPESQDFPSNVLMPGKIYVHDVTYDFGMLVV